MSYLSNILEQPTILRSVLQTYPQADPVWERLYQEWQQGPYQTLILTGMGGSYNALYPLWFQLNQRGIPALHIETSELIHYLPQWVQQQCFWVVVSQSGQSIEIRRLVEQLEAKQTAHSPSFMVSVTNGQDNPLAEYSDLPLCTNAGTEVGVATKTYTSTLTLLHLMAGALTGQLRSQDYIAWHALAEDMERCLADWPIWLAPGFNQVRAVSSFALVGRGPALASAMNGALILKEAVRLPSEGLSGGQFRHGPMEMVFPEVGVLVFTSAGPTVALSQRLAMDVAECGGQVICVGQAVTDPGVANLPLPDCGEYLNPALEVVAVQLLAAQLAEQAGITAGQFRWSGKVIQQE